MRTPSKLAELHARAFKSPRPWQASEFDRLLSIPTIRLFDAAHGFALFQIIDPDEAELLTLAIEPDKQRAGHGSHLLEGALEALSAQRIFLEVMCDNAGAIALYRRFEFQQIARRKNYYKTDQGPKDALIFERIT